jgi:hypothetical protein
MSEPLLSFRGRVQCARSPGPLGLSLSGSTGEHPGQRTVLAFSTAAPAEFPDTLDDAVVEALGAHRYRIASARREWLIGASAVHLHRDVRDEFYRALPPRSVPLRRRLFWRLVLALAASRAGLALLRAVRRNRTG